MDGKHFKIKRILRSVRIAAFAIIFFYAAYVVAIDPLALILSTNQIIVMLGAVIFLSSLAAQRLMRDVLGCTGSFLVLVSVILETAKFTSSAELSLTNLLASYEAASFVVSVILIVLVFALNSVLHFVQIITKRRRR